MAASHQAGSRAGSQVPVRICSKGRRWTSREVVGTVKHLLLQALSLVVEDWIHHRAATEMPAGEAHMRSQRRKLVFASMEVR